MTDTVTIPAVTDRADEPRPAWWRRFATTGWLAGGIELFALLPPLAMVLAVHAGQRLQYTDFWYVLMRITTGDGSLYLPGTTVLHNEHPMTLPSLLYWLDAKLFDGNNRIMGYGVVLVAVLTLVLLRAALPKTLPPLLRAGIVVTASALVFSPHGIHNFVRAMSGTAWLTANLLVITGLLLAYHRKWWPAWLFGLLGCVSYGTAFAVWPAFALMATIGREKLWRRLVPLGVGLVVVVVWIALKPAVAPGGQPAHDLASLLYTMFAVIGHLWTADNAGVAVIAGVVVVAVYVWLLTTKFARDASLRFWWALACHAVIASAMIAAARIDFGTDFGLSSRYTSLSVLMAVPAIVLTAVVAYRALGERATKLTIVALALGLVGFTLGSPTAAMIRSEDAEHQLQAVALRAGVGDSFGSTLPRARIMVPRLKAMGLYPFNGDFTLGCGGPELGSKLDNARMVPLPHADGRNPKTVAGSVDKVEQKNGGVIVRGWATGLDDPVRCAVMVDTTGEVTGGGVTHLPRKDVITLLNGIAPDVGFSVIAPANRADRVVVILESGEMRWTPAQAPE